MPAAEELWNHGLWFIRVIKIATRKFFMGSLSNIELQNRGDMSGLLTRPLDRTKPVLGSFFLWIGTGGTSFLLRDWWRKGGRTLARNGGKRTLTQMQIPILLIWPSHSQSHQSSITAHMAKLIGIIGASKTVLTSEKNLGTKCWWDGGYPSWFLQLYRWRDDR